MVNNLPGPNKGLLDAIFGGGKPEQAQAVIPGASGAPAQADATAALDFQKLLAASAGTLGAPVITATQDQGAAIAQEAVAAQQLVPQTKGELKQARKPDGKTEVKLEAELPKAKKEEVSADAALAQAALAAQSAMALPKQEVKAEVMPVAEAVKTEAVETAKAKAGKSLVAQKTVATPAVMTQQMVANAKETVLAADGKPVTSSKGQAKGETKTDASANVTSREVTNTIVQPIVIQMPLAVPVDAIAFDNEGNQSSSGRNAFSNSQDFLADRVAAKATNVLGVDRLDPRLTSRISEDRNQDSASRSDLQILMPHLTANASAPKDVLPAPTAGFDQVLSSQSRVNIQNPMALASQVNQLAANGGGAIKVRVAPENLGEITISVKSRGNQLDVQFDAASKEARDTLKSAMPELRQALAASQFEVGKLEVSSSAQSQAVSWLNSTPFDMSSMSMSNGGGSQFNSESGQRDSGNGSGSAWNRYLAEQENRQAQQDARQKGGYRQYQQQSEASA